MKIEIHRATEEEKQQAQNWETWQKEVSEFPWSYDQKETCLILKGKAEVQAEDGEKAEFGAGDWVVFPAGLSCTWKITDNLEKKYKFGE